MTPETFPLHVDQLRGAEYTVHKINSLIDDLPQELSNVEISVLDEVYAKIDAIVRGRKQ